SDGIFDREDVTIALNRRIREATVGSALGHPNLARAYSTEELWIDGKPQYLLMDLIRGKLLKGVANEDQFPTEKEQQILLDIAGALQILHQRGLLHREQLSNVVDDGVIRRRWFAPPH